jgi:hypothetical protein
MRFQWAIVLALTLGAGCSPSFSNALSGNGAFGSRADGATAGAPPAPTITIAATGPGACAASWDGQAVTPVQITQRSVALLERAIATAGGPQNVTEASLPIPEVQAPTDLGFGCADTILFALQRSGMLSVRLRASGAQAPGLADFPFESNLPPPPVPMVLGIGAGGQLTWNDAPIDAAGLAAQLGRIGSTAPSDPNEGGPPPGGLELRVGREATFGQVHALLRTIQSYHLRPFLYLPSAEAVPGRPAPPPSR